MQGAVTYSNAAKTAVLGVDPQILEHGAVSGQTARGHGGRSRKWAGTDIGLSVTGLGPGRHCC